jgi:hypothetical protein
MIEVKCPPLVLQGDTYSSILSCCVCVCVCVCVCDATAGTFGNASASASASEWLPVVFWRRRNSLMRIAVRISCTLQGYVCA